MTTPNTLLVRWRDGFVEVRDQDSIDIYGRQKGFLPLGDVTSESEAVRLGNRELIRLSTPSDQIDLVPDPKLSATAAAFVDYGLGDYVLTYDKGSLVNDDGVLLDENGDPVTDENDEPVTAWGQYRVREIAITEDSNGLVSIIPSLASRHDEKAVQIQRTLNRYLNLNSNPSPVASLIVTASTIVARRVRTVEQTVSWPETPTTTRSSPWTPAEYGRLAQIHLRLGVVDPSDDCTVVTYVDGVLVDTTTIPAGDEEAFGFINVPFGPRNKAEVQQTSTLGEGEHLTARLIQTTYQGTAN